uniref:Uncharacterized protein n=1 Tax=Anguilla anguilla TaxID=7936 RepID=A0A0E9VF15_ANGAN
MKHLFANNTTKHNIMMGPGHSAQQCLPFPTTKSVPNMSLNDHFSPSTFHCLSPCFSSSVTAGFSSSGQKSCFPSYLKLAVVTQGTPLVSGASPSRKA